MIVKIRNKLEEELVFAKFTQMGYRNERMLPHLTPLFIRTYGGIKDAVARYTITFDNYLECEEFLKS
jgi:hypothetical protein